MGGQLLTYALLASMLYVKSGKKKVESVIPISVLLRILTF